MPPNPSSPPGRIVNADDADSSSNSSNNHSSNSNITSLKTIARWLVIYLFSAAPSLASAVVLGPPESLASDDSSTRVLSRHRRFLFPKSTGWVMSAAFTLTIPIDSDITGTMTFAFPFTYTLDTGV